MNKDFLKSCFQEEKRLLKACDVCPVNVPKYRELKVSDVWELVKNDKEFLAYFPDKLPKGKQVDRTYFFNIFNTLYPDRLEAIIRHS